MEVDAVDCLVIGAGVVGLATARALALAGREVVVLERQDAIGTETSARNSEVIHAGIYYPAGSLKARLCLRGRHLLYDYCQARGIAAKAIGKLIVATAVEQEAALANLKVRAEANGVTNLRWLTAAEALADQPDLYCTAALLSPSSGILDSHAFMLSLQGEAEEAGGCLAPVSPVTAIVAEDQGFLITTGGGDTGAEPYHLRCRLLINAAGHDAPRLAAGIAGLPQETVPQAWLAKGSYFRLACRAPFTRLVYPVPEPGGLGVHITLDLGGQARFGPDVEWVEAPDYEVDPSRADSFYAAIRRYWPALPDGALLPDYAGIRPKIVGPGQPAGDFVISGPAEHGLPGLVNLYGIESPGLTASLAIAEEVAARLGERAQAA
ncbi:MAG: NAD(P)/FAD-dependent oxidoreductase [Pseudomonadota bacterium]